MQPRIARWLGLEPEDEGVVARLIVPFAASAGAATVVATGTKAAFLAAHSVARLPLVIGAQALWAIASALVFARLLGRASVERRVTVSLAIAAVTLLVLRAGLGVDPSRGSFAAVLIGPAAVQLALTQVWGTPGAMMPARQAKRTLPILASVSTAGAALGGLAAGLLGRVVAADDLLIATTLLLGLTATTLRAALQRLAVDAGQGPRPDAAGGEVISFRAIARAPLVARLAVVVALVQAGSVVLDVQLSGELSRRFDRDGMATFLGVFYGATNAVALLVGVGGTSRLVRAVGLGLCVACTAVAHLAGSIGYLALALTGVGSPLLALAAGAAVERVGQYAVARTALAMAMAPLEAARQSVARTLVETVAYRGATLATSVGVLAMGDAPLHALAPWAIAAAVLALSLAPGIGALYRRALYDALGRGRLDAVGYSEVVVDDAVARDVGRALASGNAEEVAKGLEIVRALAIPVPDATLARLAATDDETIAPRALDAFEALGRPVPESVFEAQLHATRPLVILRAALASVPHDASPAVRRLAAGLLRHEDGCVARLATVAAGTAAAAGAKPAFRSMLARGGRETRLFAIDAIGHARAAGNERDLVKMLDDPEARPRATAALARFGAALAPEAARALANREVGHEARSALVVALERAAAPACRDVLQAAAGGADRRLRDDAVAALFRLSRAPALAPDPGWLHRRALAETEELAALLGVDVTGADEARTELTRREVGDRRARTERRALLLLALLYGRRPLYRAAMQAHRGSARARSTAVELLDAHVKDPALRAIVPLVERGLAEGPAPEGPSVLDDDAWLVRVLAWARGAPDVRLDRIVKMRRVALVSALGGEALEPLLLSTSLRDLAAGAHLVRAGEVPDAMFVVVRGLLRVEVPGVPTVGPGETVGELALIDRAPRSADVVAVEASTVVVLCAQAFDEHLASHPTFARSLLQLLATRFRAAVEAR